MFKKLGTWLVEHNLDVRGNYAYGIMDGFETNVIYQAINNQSPVQFHFSCHATDAEQRNIVAQIASERIKNCTINFTQYGLLVGLNDLTMLRLLKRLEEVLHTVCKILKNNGALGMGYCPVCGEELDFSDAKKCSIEGLTISLDNTCVENINAVISAENADFDAAPNNYLRGFAGALVGGLAGAAVAALLSYFGYIAAISSFVSYFLGAFLYKKFGGKPNKVMIVIVATATFVMMALTVVVIYIVLAGVAANEAGIEMSAFEAFAVCMEEEEFSRSFYLELLLSLVFSAVGCGYEIAAEARRIKRQQNI